MNINEILSYASSNDQVREILATSNTPWYLIDKIRKNNLIQSLAEGVNIKDAENLFRSIMQSTYKNVNYNNLYLLTLLITLSNLSKAILLFKEYENTELMWMKDIFKLITTHLNSQTVTSIKAKNIVSKIASKEEKYLSDSSVSNEKTLILQYNKE